MSELWKNSLVYLFQCSFSWRCSVTVSFTLVRSSSAVKIKLFLLSLMQLIFSVIDLWKISFTSSSESVCDWCVKVAVNSDFKLWVQLASSEVIEFYRSLKDVRMIAKYFFSVSSIVVSLMRLIEFVIDTALSDLHICFLFNSDFTDI